MSLLTKLGLDSSGFISGMDKAAAAADKGNDNITKGFTKSLLSARLLEGAFNVLAKAARAAADYVGDSVTAASDLNETTTKVSVVFGKQASEIEAFAATAATSLGMTRNEALTAAGTFGNLFKSVGLSNEASADMSLGLVKLASDLASFNNMDPSEVLAKLRSGIVGETEPLKSLGININEATLKAQALKMGLIGVKDTMTTSAKVQAAYALMLQQTSLAQGDFARTSDGLANQQRILNATLGNLKATLGTAFLPLATAFTTMFGSAVSGLTPWLEGMSQQIRTWALTTVANFFTWGASMVQTLAGGVIAGAPAVVSALNQIAAYFTYMLKANSPPRLLPDLDKWGERAMQSYLGGWSQASSGVSATLNNWGDAIAPFLKQIDLGGLFTGDMSKAISDKFGKLGGVMDGYVSSYADLRKATQGVTDAQKEYDALMPDATKEQIKAAKDKLTGAKAIETQAKTAFSQAQARVLKEAEAQTKLANSQTKLINLIDKQTQAITRQADAAQGLSDQQAAAAAKALDNARLMWQMAQTDTAGKIKLLEAEAAKYAEGSLEWYQTETEKIGLEKQLQSEIAAAAKAASGGGAGGAAAIELPTLEPLVKQIGEVKQGLLQIGPKLFIDPLTMQIQNPPPTLWDSVTALGESLGNGFITKFLNIMWTKFKVSLGADPDDDLLGVLGTLGANLGNAIGDAMWDAIKAKLRPAFVDTFTYIWANLGSAFMGAYPGGVLGLVSDALTNNLLPTYGGAKANGMDAIVSTPTFFLAGESGPERVTVTPQGKAQGGTTINFYISGGNPQRNADAVMTKLRAVGMA
jgi:hypothetical protein